MTNKAFPRSNTIADFANRHSLSTSSVYRLIRSGELQAFKINNSTRIAEADERDWLASVNRAQMGDSE